MNKSKKQVQTQEQQLAVKIIHTLKSWATWSPDLTNRLRCWVYHMNMRNELELDQIIQKLEFEGKEGAAKRIEQLRDIVFKGIKSFFGDIDQISQEIELKSIASIAEEIPYKPCPNFNGRFYRLKSDGDDKEACYNFVLLPAGDEHEWLVLLPSDKLKRQALRLIEILERAIPYLGAKPAKEHIQTEFASTKQNSVNLKSQPEILSPKAKAIAALIDHPEWPDTKIAEAAGINRTTLYNYPDFKYARKVQKQRKGEIPHGSKDQEGTIEATDE
jgi:hypothetical protein